MYKCSECEMEFKEKPQYCDCGNDVFIEIKDTEEEGKTTISPDEKNSFHNDDISTKKNEYDSIKENKTRQNRTFDKSLVASLIFLFVCITLGLFILFFVGNNSTKSNNDINNKDLSNIKDDKQVSAYIPSINSIWNNAPVSATNNKEEIKKTEKPENTNTEINNKPIQTNNNISAKIKETNNITTNNKNKINSSKTTKTSNKVVNDKPKTVSSTQIKNDNVIKNNTKTTSTNNAPQLKIERVNMQEVSEYKVKLRGYITKKINFANVVGDGACAFKFRINSNGELVNKRFVNTTNSTLSDEVYEVLLHMNSYTIPPTGVKDTDMEFRVKINSGNFEVTLN